MFIALLAAASAASTQVAPSVRDLVQMSDVSSEAISPDGRSIAFQERTPSIARNRTATTWYVVPADGSNAAKPVAEGGDALWEDPGLVNSDPPTWSADSRFFYFRALLGDEIQIWRGSRDGGAPVQITHDAADVRKISLAADGTHLLYTVGSTRQEIREAEQRVYDDGVRIDGSVAVSQNLFRSGWLDGKLVTTRLSHNWFGKRGLLDDRPEIVHALDPATGSVSPPTTPDAKAANNPTDLSRFPEAAKATSSAIAEDGRRVAFVSGEQPSATRLSAYLADGALQTCSAKQCTGIRIVSVAWRPRHDEVLFTSMDLAKAQSLFLWDVASGQVRAIAHGQGLLDAGDDDPGKPCAVGEAVVACTASSAGSPPRLVEFSLASRPIKTLFDPNPAISAMEGVHIETLHWQDPDGHAFTGQLAMPYGIPPGQRAPLFITYYVCNGFLRGGLGDEWPLLPMAASGIATLCVNAAATSGRYDAGKNYDLALSGIRAAIGLLDKRGLIDPAHVGMGGLSFGSEVTLWVALHSKLLAAASTASPSIESTYYWMNAIDRPDLTDNLRKVWKLGPPRDDDPQWHRISAARNIDALHIPLLIQSPEHEFRFEAEFLSKALAAGKAVEMYAFADEPHLKVQPRHKLAAYQRNLDWFRFWLQGYEDPAPEKADQYERWSRMRIRGGGGSVDADAPIHGDASRR